ncbi:uncharacterized protein LACBIDRAFT_315413 [Laccaria bicolor S238N-H82]|uniref:Predicted protein n=1 Tax=Laccaria bicolor (strain S238N-H82 / ATCC MYA-4686) TaxID=486041 RepID=B0D2B9_LACBS|nr:uncharacterized protein LACBIDRAFT_315413 [Laccaria bicolor S238N-H82]EDR10718.1 predicted protein [Laccaria bicolor S238N-H82]|eukprot:XP_001878019.1 predicted protein [Laccaria bicolor S238N-H82]
MESTSTLLVCTRFIMAPSLKNRTKDSRSNSTPYEDLDRICGCLAYCHGERIPVSGRTYRRHTASRDQELLFSAEFMAFLAPAPSPGPSQSNLPNTSSTASPPAYHEGTDTLYLEADTHVGMAQSMDLRDGINSNLVQSPTSSITLTRDTGYAPAIVSLDDAGSAYLEASASVSTQPSHDPGSLEDDSRPSGDQAFAEDVRVLFEDIDLEGLSDLVQLSDIKESMVFIRALDNAKIDDEFSSLSSDVISRLRNPPTSPVNINCPDLRLGLDLFISVINSPQQTYTSAREAILRRHPDDKIPTYDQVKRRIADITGVEAMEHDMCIKTCLAYTGPFADLHHCPICGEARWDSSTKKARQTFHTIPIGPQLQALWRDKDSAERMKHRRKLNAKLAELLRDNNGSLPTIDDYFYGSDYIEAVRDGRIQENDMVLMLSFDGAQLYRNKQSDCWIYIWVIMDLDPGIRYKKKFVLPGAVIPGPNKPKKPDSFLFPGLHHVAALQNEGLRIWDASQDLVAISKLFFAIGAADGPGLVYLNGFVGHHGKNGCRVFCSLIGRHKPGVSHYYPAFYKPHNYSVAGCDHGDYSYENPPPRSLEEFERLLRYLMASPNETQYKKRRLESGICKPSLILGLNPRHKTPLPRCFGPDCERSEHSFTKALKVRTNKYKFSIRKGRNFWWGKRVFHGFLMDFWNYSDETWQVCS